MEEVEDAEAGHLPSEDHSRPTIHLPGSLAPVYHGRKLLRSCLRYILRGKCRLSSFARSFVSRRFDQKQSFGTACRSVFPMPIPYPEVLRGGAADESLRGAVKRWVCGVVICLNYLYLGRPRSAGLDVWLGKALTSKQWAAIGRLEHLAAAWFHVSPVGPEEMGRTAEKVETMNSMLDSLETQAAAIGHFGQNYFPAGMQDDRPGNDVRSGCRQIGTSESSSMSTFKPVDPSRLSFIGTPSFDPGPYLDPLSRRIFEDPLQERMKPADFVGKPPKLRVHCSRSDRIRLFELLDASNRLALFEAKEVTLQFGSGLFAVVKDMDRDRMILDSRGANCLEVPPGRWIRSLANGESLTRLSLEPAEALLFSGNDLRDFYYLFGASESRSRRNVLVGGVHPREVSHLHCFKPHHGHTKQLFGSLASLAMGDCQAVELAQSCHLSMALQHGVLSADSLLTMEKPLPRSSTVIGVVIDDFVAISKVASTFKASGDEMSEGANAASLMQEVYKDVGLIPHEKKAFRDETHATFWGVDVDGTAGLVRGSLKRAIPLAGILFKMAELGVSTGGLMQVVVGSLISLFLYRRRLLALLDPLFGAYRGVSPRAIVALSGEVRSTLCLCGMLLPLSVTNLRAASPQVIAASDASGWGEAGVIAGIPRALGKEMLRHSLRKSVWTKLLAPADAWLRSHDLLEAEDELPSEDIYRSNPLFELCAEAPDYRLLFASAKKGNRHINIGEVRAALKVEKLLGERSPSSRVLLGADSQVALGTLIKGRATSRALNQELQRSLPWMLGFDVYLDCLYFHTKLNRGDDPTRGRDIRAPSREWPGWLQEMQGGQFDTFDLWLKEHGLDDLSLSGLPPFSELEHGTDLPAVTRRSRSQGSDCKETESKTSEVKASRWSSVPERGNPVADACPRDRCCSKTGLPGEETELTWKPPSFPVPTTEDGGGTGPLRGRTQFPGAGDDASVPGPVSGRSELVDEAVVLLTSFPRNMFVVPKGSLWPPCKPGYLDLFSGKRGVARELAQNGCWSLCIDLAHGPEEDVMNPSLQEKLRRLVDLDVFLGAGGGPVCTSFSTAITPAVRTREAPYGLPDVSERMKVKIEDGNRMAIWMFSFLEHCLKRGLRVWMENPAGSFMFKLPEWLALQTRWPSLKAWLVDYCRYGTPWRKRTKFFTDGPLGGVRTLCKCSGPHQLLRGRSAVHRKSWTAVAQAYPVGVCKELTQNLLSVPREEVANQRNGPLSDIAMVGGGRTGEASNPGPRRPRTGRAGTLDDVNLVEPRTMAIQTRVWNDFADWMNDRLSSEAVDSVLKQHGLLALVLKEYGNCIYGEGRSLFVYRHLVVYTQQSFIGIKPHLQCCWDLIARWEIAEPPSHRVPIPEPIAKALMVCAILWGWRRFAAVLGISFFGISRPGEPLKALRKHLILPGDLLQENFQTAYLRVENPKSRRRGIGKVQHLSVEVPVFVEYLNNVYKADDRHEPLLRCSASAFRRRWDALVDALLIPATAQLTPGGLRGGGCVSSFQKGVSIPLLLWKMRLRQQQTLENYLQEAVADSVIPGLPSNTRQRIAALASLFDLVMRLQP